MKPNKGRRGAFSDQNKRKSRDQPEIPQNDVYEADDVEPEEDRLAGKRYDVVESYEYQLPEDFEDEEIDEDEAFNSEDERLYGHLFGDQGGSGPSQIDEESGEDDDLLESDEDGGTDEEEQDELDDMFADVGDDGVEDDAASEGEDEDEEAHEAMLRAVVGNIELKKANKKDRGWDVVVTEAYQESEFNLPPGQEGQLTLTDLIDGLGDGRARLGAARKTLERLEKRAAPVAAPLPGPVRDRQERRAGYETAKQEVSKWLPIVKANREAPTLHFKADAAAVPRTVTTASLAAKHEPETAMEAEVAALLQAAGAQSAAAVAEAEEALAMKALSVSEARERREKLAKMRALLFYHEVKAKRLKKIKSKEYRRRLKKAETRKKAAAGGEDVELDEEALRQELEEAEFERAKERLTLKHKNTSRFIRRALKRGTTMFDEGTKAAVAEQLRLGDELRRRVRRLGGAVGKGDYTSGTDASDDDDDSSSGDENGSDARDGSAKHSKGLSSKVRKAALELLEAGTTDGASELPSTGLFALPFMQRAMERRKIQAQETAKEALGLDDDGPRSHRDEDGGRASGRFAFKGSGGSDADKIADRVRQLEAMSSDDDGDDIHEDVEAKAERLERQLQLRGGNHVAGVPTDELPNDSRGERTVSTNGKRQRNEGHPVREAEAVTIGPPSVTATQAADKDGPCEFLPTDTFQGVKPGYVFKKGDKGTGYYRDAKPLSAASKGRKKPRPWQEAAPLRGDEAEDAHLEDEAYLKPYEKKSNRGNNALGLTQEDLVRQAFAGDDVMDAFAAAKAQEVEGELPSEDIPGALPGWGTWASSKKEPHWAVAARAKAEARKKAAAAARKDSNLQYVVISEKWDKKNAKYRTPSVPFPYESKEMYERAMRQPLGKDFNTDAAFRNMTRPAVVKDAGVIIQPIRFSAAMADHASKMEGGTKRPAVLTVAGGMPKRTGKAKRS